MANTTAESSALDYDAPNLVKTIYKSTWGDFYTWEQAYCQQTLHSLTRNLPQDAPASASEPVEDFAPFTRSLTAQEPQAFGSEDETFTAIDYTVDGEPEITTFSAITVEDTRTMEPCAPYEMCTPTSRNIIVGDDSEYMPFIPLIDDPTFDALRHAEDYKYFEWQLPHRDPDCERQLKSLSRLSFSSCRSGSHCHTNCAHTA
ncbi:hypothetical protein DXG01_007685 [Tephrocybe rancida]|nr:hypothetical protein DXG01_007685 [Tephrocybe rancida]